MAILRPKRGGIDLHFLHERGVDSNPHASVSALVNAQTAEGSVVEQHAIRDIRVFETRPARNGRIHRARPKTAGHAWAHVEYAGDAATERQVIVFGVRDVRSYCRALTLDGDGGCNNLNRLSD